MGNKRDWRESYSQLELVRQSEQDSQAASEAVSGILSLVQPVAEMELILPAAEAAPKAKGPAKRKATAKTAKNARKPAAPKKPVRKPAARKAKPKAAATRRTTAATKLAKAAPPEAAAIPAQTAAMPLPDIAEPLTAPARPAEVRSPQSPPPEPLAPLPRKASLAHYRKGGLIEAIGFWLRTATRRAKAKLGASKVLSQSVEPANEASELAELKEENERLRRQLDALLTLSDAAQFKFQS